MRRKTLTPALSLKGRGRKQVVPEIVVKAGRLPGPKPGVVVTVPLILLPAWYGIHRVEPVSYDAVRGVLMVKGRSES